MNLPKIGRVGLGPAGRVAFEHGDGKFGAGLAMRRVESAGIDQEHGRGARRENAGGCLAVFFGAGHDRGHGAGAIVGRGAGGRWKIPLDLGIFLRTRHGQQAGIFRLAARQGSRCGHRAPQLFVIGLVSGGARGAPVKDSAHGNGERLLGDVLVNGVVGEAG